MSSPTMSMSAHAGLMNKLPAFLRIVGAGALLVAMYSFLALGWQSGNDLTRYGMLLGHTVFLAAVGVASGHWLKEGKGARLLLTLALVSVPVNFAILGALILSQFGPVDVSRYPHYLTWAVDSLPAALLTTGGALVALLPVVLLAFRVLARSMSGNLSRLFLLSNLALLLPIRDPQWIAVVVIALAIGVVWFSRKTARNQMAAKTAEGVVALGLQLLPLGLLLGRSLWLYAFDLFLATVLAVTVFFVLRQISLCLKPASLARNALDAVSLLPALSVMPLFASALTDAGMVASAVTPLGATAAALLVYDISGRTGRFATVYRYMSILVVLAGAIGNLPLFADPLAAVICGAIGVTMVVLGYHRRQLGVFAGGWVLVLAALVHQLVDLIRYFDLGSWAGLAVLGTLLILAASVLESKGGKWGSKLAAWRGQLQAWQR